MFELLLNIGVPAAIGLFGLVFIGLIFARLYHRATKETAFVRTGLGGQKVVMDGGAIVLPIFHETIPVNMNTLKLEVSRREEQSLIALDRMRVDVAAAFFVRVRQVAESVSTAAQTLGRKTMAPNELKILVEDKFVDALRATAATMTMQELQDKRREFVQAVQNAVAEDLEKNGLELEAVSLTSMDQTSKEFFNPNNAFDAEGLTRLTQETEARRKQRNDVEQDTEVQVRTKNLEAERLKLDITKQQEFATLTQQQEIANAKADQVAEIAKIEAERHREAEEVRINAERLVKERRIEADRTVNSAEIDKNLTIQKKTIEAERETKVKQAEQRQSVELANQDAAIAIARKSQEQSQADAVANAARAEAVKAEEAVNTAREVAIAERGKSIQLIDATREAEQSAISVKVSAEAEREAAENRALALKVEADAKREAALAEAEGIAAINEAKNRLGAAQIDLAVRMQLIQALPSIIQEASRPMEKIDSIRLFQVNGMPMGGGSGHAEGNGAHSNGSGSLPEQVMNSALQYQVAKPIVDAIMKDAGLANPSLTGISQTVAGMLSSGGSTAVPPKPQN
ncbi:MAG: flotillin family protein [Hydrogenophaga sp.]|uniref:flotillin family protein n=1 Tax=Hydrogenophaga sp. TaxID=1904254 RepID=UPI0027202AAB|nr:flotillin family protein [Hydrogenophaga sp.]MDO9483518.1 flotillin family protein [Hydrogenophaga sp.]MDP3343813.1 flotillin family protein [Hydrogenophaga sp.]MDP3808496.1 flotillin family protein [Hydrogenophaga sp.]MDP3924996.1 flotillin family protein [Hydrogenophaga sp.]